MNTLSIMRRLDQGSRKPPVEHWKPKKRRIIDLPNILLAQICSFVDLDYRRSAAKRKARGEQKGRYEDGIASLCLSCRRLHEVARPFQLRVLKLAIYGMDQERHERCRSLLQQAESCRHIRVLHIVDRLAMEASDGFNETVSSDGAELVARALQQLGSLFYVKIHLTSGTSARFGQHASLDVLEALRATPADLARLDLTLERDGVKAYGDITLVLMRHQRSLQHLELRLQHMDRQWRRAQDLSAEPDKPIELAFLFALPTLMFISSDIRLFSEGPAAGLYSRSLSRLSFRDVSFDWICDTLLLSLRSPLKTLSMKFSHPQHQAELQAERHRIYPCPTIDRLELDLVVQQASAPTRALAAFARAKTRSLLLRLVARDPADAPISAVATSMTGELLHASLLPSLEVWELFLGKRATAEWELGAHWRDRPPSQVVALQSNAAIDRAASDLWTARKIKLNLLEE